MRLLQTFRLAPVVLPLLLAGCGGEFEDTVKLVPVKGTILRNGEPLANAQVSFTPDPGNADPTPGGDVTGSDGTYVAKFRNRFGLAPGKYKVIVSPGPEPDDTPVDSSAQEAFANDPFMLGEMKRSAAGAKSRKPKKADFKEEFDAEVSASGEVVDRNLKPPAATAAKSTNATK